jgi:hypothetical protein
VSVQKEVSGIYMTNPSTFEEVWHEVRLAGVVDGCNGELEFVGELILV